MAFVATRYTKGPYTTLNLDEIPKRYSRYGSLLLLGPTFESHTSAWAKFLTSLNVTEKSDLFRNIVEHFKDRELTHVAINAPIAAAVDGISSGTDNVMRSPAGLRPVYGDFGPSKLENEDGGPSQVDFEAAYWTCTTQLKDIAQVWAPRWTMFSRGNITEKARILQEAPNRAPFPGLTQPELGERIEQIDVVDFYVGIGYFAFPYLSRGVRRVWGWDINGWSVEGLKRGCVRNGWGVRIIKIDGCIDALEDQQLKNLAADIDERDGSPDAIRCIVFWGDNKWANTVLSQIARLLEHKRSPVTLNVRHCNLGLLPTSRDSWEGAIRLLDPHKSGWLHVHENAEEHGIHEKQLSIVRNLQRVASEVRDGSWLVTCEHVEQVKTYAPGVVHCVFDIKIYSVR